VLGLAGLGSVANAAAASAPPPAWHVVYSQAVNSEFEAVVATGKTTGFAFDEPDATVAVPTAYERTGTSTFKKVPFPTVASEWIAGAGGSSPSDVYVFADILTLSAGNPESQVLKWTGSKFSVVATFAGELGGGTVVSADDVYAYGYNAAAGVKSAGDYHYDGHKWTKISATIAGSGDALSATSAYVAEGSDLNHYNGHAWTATNLTSLFPKQDTHPQLNGVLALSADNVYVDGAGLLLHDNGHAWSKVASYPAGLVTAPPASDGKGGLWFSAGTNLLHYSGGKLTVVAAPKFDGDRVFVNSIALIPGTSQELAGGGSPAVAESKPGYYYHPPVVLQYS
jgi:hypothetical protein